VDYTLNFSYALEGRVMMNMMTYYMMHYTAGDQEYRDKLLPAYRRVLGAYKKAASLTGKTVLNKSDLPVMVEYALATYYGFLHFRLLRITEDGIRDILMQGKNAIDASLVLDSSLIEIQSQINLALESLQRA